MSTHIFASAYEQREAEFAWLDRLLWVAVQRFHEAESKSGGGGWFVPRQRVEGWLTPPAAHPQEGGNVREELQAMRDELDAICTASEAAGVWLPLQITAKCLALNPLERLCLLLCFASETTAKYGKVYAYLQDDLNRKLPTPGLLESLAFELGLPGSYLIPPTSVLYRWRATQASEHDQNCGRLHAGLQLDPTFCSFLQSEAPLSAETRKAEWPDNGWTANVLDLARRDWKLLLEYYGPARADGVEIARSIAIELGAPFVRAECRPARSDDLVRAMLTAKLNGSVLFVSGLEQMPPDAATSLLKSVEPLLTDGPVVMGLELDGPWFPAGPLPHMVVLPLEMRLPSYEERVSHWSSLLSDAGTDAGDLSRAAALYKLPLVEIGEIARHVSAAAQAGKYQGRVTLATITAHCRARYRSSLTSLARLISPKQSWSSLVVPAESMTRLQEICGHVRQRPRVLHEWGFGARLSNGRGLYVLFSGPSGTGKTLAAEVVAGELGVDVLKVDLSAVVSKYIGETEKNLEKIFESAERMHCILFFDEADALFGKRSEVKDAHDRYSNIEINFLLQRLEEFEGVVILATNFAQNIDEAFSRRIHLAIDFPFPDEEARLNIWRSHIPRDTPISSCVDFGLLARHFEISGGNIRNVVWNAAFMAAGAESDLSMNHLLRATEREYEKIGKPYRRAEALQKSNRGGRT